jgi:hypothetical protein
MPAGRRGALSWTARATGQSLCIDAKIAVTPRGRGGCALSCDAKSLSSYVLKRRVGLRRHRAAHAPTDESSVLTRRPEQIMKGFNHVNVWGYIRDNQ